MHKQSRNSCNAIEGLTEYNDKFKKSVKQCLLKNSENHCSYCDSHFYNTGNLIIEHFKNRNTFPELATDYSNLYAACFSCNNRKRDESYPDTEPLRPDSIDYEFDKYFYIEVISGEIIPKPNAKDVAEITLEFLNLNNSDAKKARKDFIFEWMKTKQRPGKSFRFIEL